MVYTTFLSGAMPADPKASSMPKAHAVPPTRLLHVCAVADGDLVAVDVKWAFSGLKKVPIFTDNRVCTSSHSSV